MSRIYPSESLNEGPGSDISCQVSSLHWSTLALRVSVGRYLALISHVKTMAFRVSGGKNMALMSHVKTPALKSQEEETLLSDLLF